MLRKLKWCPHTSKSDRTFEDLLVEYQKSENRWKLAYVISAYAIAYLLWEVLCKLNELRGSLLPSTEFVFTPLKTFWGFPALFLAFFAADILVRFFCKRSFGEKRYAEFIDYLDRKIGIDQQRAIKKTAMAVLPLIGIVVILGNDNYLYTNKDGVVINEFFGVGERLYTWPEVKRITLVKPLTAPNGDIRRESHFVLQMTNDVEFNFNKTLIEASFGDQSTFASFIADKAKISITIDESHP